MMDLPVHIGMDLELEAVDQGCAAMVELNNISLLILSVGIHPQLVFYPKQSSGTEKYIFKKYSLPLMKRHYCEVMRYMFRLFIKEPFELYIGRSEWQTVTVHVVIVKTQKLGICLGWGGGAEMRVSVNILLGCDEELSLERERD